MKRNEIKNPNNVGPIRRQQTASHTKLIIMVVGLLIATLIAIILVSILLSKKQTTGTMTTTTVPITFSAKESCPKLDIVKKYDISQIALSDIAIADVNGDSIDDAIISAERGQHIKIFLNFANGHLTTENIYTTDGEIKRMVPGDMNNDGRLDIIGLGVIRSGPQKTIVNILYNSGNGTFDDKLALPTDGLMQDIAVGHINEDDRLDVIIVYDYTMEILYNLGDKQFTNQIYRMDHNPEHLEVTDINNDNKPDFIVADGQRNIDVILNNENGTFLRPVVYSTRDMIDTILAMDINDDHQVDFISGSMTSKSFQVFLNQGNGKFYHSDVYSTAFDLYSISIGDINNDQKPDLVLDYFDKNTIDVRLNIGNGTFGNHTIYSINFGPQLTKIIDLSGDGYMELLTIGYRISVMYISILWTSCQFIFP